MGISLQFRRGIATDWIAANPILLPGELGLETDTRKFKFGDGASPWNNLNYSGGEGGGGIPVLFNTDSGWGGTNPVLLEGQIGVNTTYNLIKIGTGSNAWNNLPYVAGNMAMLNMVDREELTIVGGEITISGNKSLLFITPEVINDVATNLVTINGGNYGEIIFLLADYNYPNYLTLDCQTGNIREPNGLDSVVIKNEIAEWVALINDGENWVIMGAHTTQHVLEELETPAIPYDQWTGQAEWGTMGYAASFGDVMYLSPADGKWELAKADAVATSGGKLGMCLKTGIEDAVCLVLLSGKLKMGRLPTLVVGAPVYLDYANDGLVITTMPAQETGRIVRIIGYGNKVDELYFCPDNNYLEYV